MARDPKISQADPTAPRPVDADGRLRDEWDLPLNGPARARALAAAGKPDPRDVPAAWMAAPAPAPKPQD